MTALPWQIALGVSLALLVAAVVAANRFLKPFFWRIVACLVPLYLAGVAVCNAWYQYENRAGGFKLGVDLVGGTDLVYEIDQTKERPADYRPDQLTAALKRRIDPTDLYNVTIRPLSDTRVEIILPTGGEHQADVEKKAWEELLGRVRTKWGDLPGLDEAGRGKIPELVSLVHKQTGAPEAEVEAFVKDNYKPGQEKKDLTQEKVQDIKDLIAQVGSLEFRILANDQDDKEAIEAAKAYIESPSNQAVLKEAAEEGKPPPPPVPPEGKPAVTRPDGTREFVTKKGNYTYSWVELGPQERAAFSLNNDASEGKRDPDDTQPSASRKADWDTAAAHRNKTMTLPGGFLLYSRECQDRHLPLKQRAEKKYEYFLLVRNPEIDPVTGEPKSITGQHLAGAAADHDERLRPSVAFRFDNVGGDRFHDVTSKNLPENTGEGGTFSRHLAIILDGQIVSAPSIMSAISTNGQITGTFTPKEVERLVSILRAGALPATLKPQPVSENTMGATLGADTIRKGTWAVGIAFVVILAFMIAYYRFAGLVASAALLANLLLTIGFMVVVNATFTLPGLAGLVLMLGMAVDANVLIYERLREERDRGASLALAIRNGYDRAFPTIIDTHLSSIFTAIVLYAVGNDQLKGFGISLTVGLIISLFTSLFMTRLLFDVWLSKNWLHKLSMFRLFSRPNIDFMRIRYYWFTATVLLTVFGITVFLVRGKEGLGNDFNGGTAIGVRLTEPMNLQELRGLLSEQREKERLQLEAVNQLDTEGRRFQLQFADGTKETITLANASTPEAVKKLFQEPTEWSIEPIYLSKEPDYGGGKSKFFTFRTNWMEREPVQVALYRLLGEPDQGQWKTFLYQASMEKPEVKVPGKEAVLRFKDYASPGQVKMLLEQEFKDEHITTPFDVARVGEESDGRYKEMRLLMSKPVDAGKFQAALNRTEAAYKARPQPERLENFDSQLAEDTQKRAMYAILASWGAILLYLWFRFGSWTFGLAAVLCLIHDLFFTMGIIAFCHYIHEWWPGLARALLIQDFKIDLPAVAALLTLVGYSVNDTIVVFDRIREVRGKNPDLTPQMINDSVNQTLSRTLLTSFATWLVVIVLYLFGGEGVHLFAFCMVVGVIVGTYSSIYIASPLLLIFGEGRRPSPSRERQLQAQPAPVA
jgi:SecD/SecF fusion protein